MQTCLVVHIWRRILRILTPNTHFGTFVRISAFRRYAISKHKVFCVLPSFDKLDAPYKQPDMLLRSGGLPARLLVTYFPLLPAKAAEARCQ